MSKFGQQAFVFHVMWPEFIIESLSQFSSVHKILRIISLYYEELINYYWIIEGFVNLVIMVGLSLPESVIKQGSFDY